jgi:two-component system response regulator HydG
MWAREQMQVQTAPSAHPDVLVGITNLPTQLEDYRAHRRKANPLPVATAGDRLGSGYEHPGSAIVSIADVEKRAILGTLRQLNGDKLMAARRLGIGKTTLYRRLKEYGLAGSGKSIGN